LTESPDTAVRAADFIHAIGINVHMEYTDGAYASLSDVTMDLAYLGVDNIRDMIPNLSAGGIPAQSELSALESLAAGRVKLDLFTGQTETDIATDISVLNTLAAAEPGAIAAVEGPNEINNFPVSYDGLTGQGAATAEQEALYSAVTADSALRGAQIFNFTGGLASPLTPYGSLTQNPDGSYVLDNGITGWLAVLPVGESTISITYTGAAPLAGLFGWPGAGQQTGLTQGVNGTLSFTYDNTGSAPLQTYVTVSAWSQTTTITGVSAVAGGANLVTFDPDLSLAGQATAANIHPYPSDGATPGAAIATGYDEPYGPAAQPSRVITEDGYSTDPNDPNGVSQAAQAQGDLDILLDGYKDGIAQTYLYELLNEQPDPTNSNTQFQFGLFNDDNTPKPAAIALHNLTSILADPGASASDFTPASLNWSATGLPDTANSLLLETSNGVFDLALWNETTLSSIVTNEVTLALGGTFGSVSLFDPLTGLSPVESLSDISSLTLALGSDPLIVELANPSGDPPPTPCFLAGTMITTDAGEMPVEQLAIGDLLVTVSGVSKPIKWLGRRVYRQPYDAGQPDLIPVLIEAGALGDGLPRRDLSVSPLHAIYLEGVLIPAGKLVNGGNIRFRPGLAAIDYIHIELDAHDIILAEGAPCESFVDCDSRWIFQNAGEFAQLYPDDATPSWAFCAPRVESGQTLRRIRRRLAHGAPEAPASARLAGFVDVLDHQSISGWAWLPDYPDETLELEVLDGEGVIAQLRAGLFRRDLLEAGIGNGRYAFTLQFQNGLARHAAHEIHVRRAGGGACLSNSPRLLAASPMVPPPPAARLVHSAAEPAVSPPKRALVLDTLWPDAGRDAGSAAIVSHIEGLQRLGYEVEFCAADAITVPPAALAALPGVLCRGAPDDPSIEALLRRHGGGYALIYMHRLPIVARYAGLVRAHCPGPDGKGAHIIYGVADLHHLRLARQAAVEGNVRLAIAASNARLHEMVAMAQADSVITHSAPEAAYIGAVLPSANVHLVPWAVPAAATRPAVPRHGIAFIGSFGHEPNQDAVRWLLAEILPLVWRHYPEMRCQIAGSGWHARSLPALDPRVRLLGRVPNLQALLDSVRLTVAPLRFGAGLKGKVLESLAAGCPCIMTPIAAEGIPLTPALRQLVAPDAASLAALICHHAGAGDFDARLGRAGQRLIARHFHESRMLEGLHKATLPARRKV